MFKSIIHLIVTKQYYNQELFFIEYFVKLILSLDFKILSNLIKTIAERKSS